MVFSVQKMWISVTHGWAEVTPSLTQTSSFFMKKEAKNVLVPKDVLSSFETSVWHPRGLLGATVFIKLLTYSSVEPLKKMYSWFWNFRHPKEGWRLYKVMVMVTVTVTDDFFRYSAIEVRRASHWVCVCVCVCYAFVSFPRLVPCFSFFVGGIVFIWKLGARKSIRR